MIFFNEHKYSIAILHGTQCFYFQKVTTYFNKTIKIPICFFKITFHLMCIYLMLSISFLHWKHIVLILVKSERAQQTWPLAAKGDCVKFHRSKWKYDNFVISYSIKNIFVILLFPVFNYFYTSEHIDGQTHIQNRQSISNFVLTILI